MIEIGVALAAIKSAHGALMSAVKVGRDLSQLGTAISKYAKGEAALQAKAEAKKSSFFSKLSGVENSAIDEFMHKKQQDQMRDQLRETFQLYGKKGDWEQLQSFIAKERARLKDQYIREEKRRQMWKDIGIAFLITSAVALVIGVIGFLFVETTEVAYYAIY
ncbi:MAG: hypothetical protein CML19_11465 [Pusillimonas sp.]|nr:hypothetical protein [Pusillimonas sp.]